MMTLKISFAVNVIIHASFVEDRQNSNVKHVGRIEIDIRLVNTSKKFNWYNVSVFQL
jgi:hypothetical protein